MNITELNYSKIGSLFGSISKKYTNSQKTINTITCVSFSLALLLAIIYNLFGIKYLFNPVKIFNTPQTYPGFYDQPFYFSTLINGTMASLVLIGVALTLMLIRKNLDIHKSHQEHKILGLAVQTWSNIFIILIASLPFIGNQFLNTVINLTGDYAFNLWLIIALGILGLYPSFIFVYTYKDLIKLFLLGLVLYLILPVAWIFYAIPNAIATLYKKFARFLTTGRYAKIKITVITTIAALVLGLGVAYMLSLVDPVFAKYINDIIALTVSIMREYLTVVFIFVFNFFMIFFLLFGYISLLPEIPLLISYKRFQRPLKHYKPRAFKVNTSLYNPVLLIIIVPVLILLSFNIVHTYHLTTLKDLELLRRYQIVNYPQFAIKGVKYLVLVIGILITTFIVLYKAIVQLFQSSPKLITFILSLSALNFVWASILSWYKVQIAINYSGPTVRRLGAFLVISILTISIISIFTDIFKRLKQSKHSIFMLAFINDISIDFMLLSILLSITLFLTPINSLSIALMTQRIIRSHQSHGFIYLFNKQDTAFNPELINTYKTFYANYPNSLKTSLLFEYIQEQQSYITQLIRQQSSKAQVTSGSIIPRLLITNIYTTIFSQRALDIPRPSNKLTEYLQQLYILPEKVKLNSCTYSLPQDTQGYYEIALQPLPTDPNNNYDFYESIISKEYLLCTFITTDKDKLQSVPTTYEVYFLDQRDSLKLKIYVITNTTYNDTLNRARVPLEYEVE